jgi:cytochrome c-type biogenesis protein CcmH
MTFQIWIICLALLLIGAIFFIFPLWQASRQKINNPISEKDQSILDENIRLFYEQLADIEQQKNNSRISETEFASLKLELERNLLQSCQGLKADTAATARKALKGIYLLAFAIFVGMACWLYQHLGASADLEIAALYNQKQQSDYQSMLDGKAPDLSKSRELQSHLEDRLKDKPENLHYWFLLGRLSSEQNDFAKAASAYEEVLKRDKTSGLIKAELAQAMFLRDKHQMTDTIGQLAAEALEQEPNNTTALGLTGIYQFSNKNYLEAIKTWKKAVELLGPNSESGRGLTQGIERAKQLYLTEGGNAELLEAPGSKIITLNVSLGADVKARADQLVYVYARAWRGPKMPLAIHRLQVSELPATVRLDETMAMSPQFTLTNASQIEVVARISEDGSATSQPGDWQASEGPFDIEKLPSAINLKIEKRLE